MLVDSEPIGLKPSTERGQTCCDYQQLLTAEGLEYR